MLLISLGNSDTEVLQDPLLSCQMWVESSKESVLHTGKPLNNGLQGSITYICYRYNLWWLMHIIKNG